MCATTPLNSFLAMPDGNDQVGANIEKQPVRSIHGLKFILGFAAGTLFLFFLTRLVLSLIFYERLAGSDWDVGLSFLFGLRMDSMTVSMLFVVPVLVYCLALGPKTWLSGILKVYFLLLGMALVFIEIATVPFFTEYDCRPNEVFIDYLRYPGEVLPTVWETNKWTLLLALSMMAGMVLAFRKWSPQFVLAVPKPGVLARAGRVFLGLVILFLGIRSSFGHRPANLADAAFSNSHLVNEITKNSLYNLGFTLYSRMKYSTDINLYGEMDPEKAISRVRARLGLPEPDGHIPFGREEETHFPSDHAKNLVIILEESLGAQFVEAFGGEPGLTPNLSALADEGVAFENLYATGTRSVRGMEAVAAGFLPVPGESVVKRDKAQHGFFTLAALLGPLGYETSFIYGGEERFDNMGRWYRGNGFDVVIDENDYENPIFRGIWGVCDEDLFNKAHGHFEEMHRAGKPFFSLVFTTSFHSPFEYPAGRVPETIDGSKLKGAVAYADYALGHFFELARAADYFKDTVFLVIADHDVRVFGRELVPIEHFKLPGVIVGADVPKMKIPDLVSQPDAVATALDFLGRPLHYPILGRSVFEARNQVAFMQYHDTYALMTPKQAAIVTPNQLPKTFRRTEAGLVPTQPNADLEEDLLAFIHTASYLYENKLHTSQTNTTVAAKGKSPRGSD